MADQKAASVSLRPSPRLRFGLFELDRATGTLLRNGAPVRLPPQPLAMLIELVEHAGEEVTREHLQKTIWPADTFVDFDASIGSCIRKIRQVLGDTSDNPIFVRTLHRKGFQFIAPVHIVLPGVPGPHGGERRGNETAGSTALSAPEVTAPEVNARYDASLGPGIRVSSSVPESDKPEPVPVVVVRSSREGLPWFHVSMRWIRWLVPAALLTATGCGLLLWWLPRLGTFGERSAMTVLTSYPGGQYYPALSPDGNQVAFVWTGEEKKDSGVARTQVYRNIYIAATNEGGGVYRRITNASADDAVPAWSPDGSRIAFVRGTSDLMLIGSLGGNERKVAEALPYSVNWSPDGKEIAYAAWDSTGRRFAVFAVSLDTGIRRQLTYPPGNADGDSHADFSPDGRWLAFVRCSVGNCDIYVSSSGGGAARQVTSDRNSSFHGLTWSPDGRSIVYSSSRRGQYRLWQVNVAAPSDPREVVSAGEGANYPRFASGQHGNWRLIYEKRISDSNIWQLHTVAGAGNGQRSVAGPARRLIASTRLDSSPQISPDGRRIVLVSDRTGYNELWTADADGGNEIELTFLRSREAGSPRWSPDGTRIAFDVLSGAGRAVFVVDARGGAPSQWTEWSDASRPSWSGDGQWIYYSHADANSQKQIWKISTGAGRQRLQVTRDGGFGPTESPDGKTLFYTSGNHLRSMPVVGGAWSSVVDRTIAHGWWGLAAGGVYFVDLYGSDPPTHVRSGPKPIYFLNLKSGAVTKVADIVGEVNRPTPDFAVSADGGTILYSILEVSTCQVQVIEETH